MTTVDVSNEPATVDDGTSVRLQVENTGSANAFLTPWRIQLHPGERGAIYPEGREVTAFCNDDETTTLSVTVVVGALLRAPQFVLQVPDLTRGNAGFFGLESVGWVHSAEGALPFVIPTGFYALSSDGDVIADDVNDEWMFATFGTDHFVIKKPGWYVVNMYAAPGAADFRIQLYGANQSVIGQLRDVDPVVGSTQTVINYYSAGDEIRVQTQAIVAPEDDVTFDYISLLVQPLAVNP